MIDLHCHVLPGVDDGPETVDGAIALARLARADGIAATAAHGGLYVVSAPLTSDVNELVTAVAKCLEGRS